MIYRSLLALVVGATLSTASMAATCSIDIESNDAMKFSVSEVNVGKSCKEFTVNLKHVGKLPKSAMGHNWVLTRTADMQAVATDGIAAGLANDYIKKGDTRVIAHTKVVGPGESTSVKFPVSALKAGESYTFFCSFAGHSGVMKGAVKLVD